MTKPRRNKGWFKKGKDSRRNPNPPTQADCRKGYLATLAKMRAAGREEWFKAYIRGLFMSARRGKVKKSYLKPQK